MGSDGTSDNIYDLRRIEDVFACLEIISFAQGTLYAIEPDLADRLGKVSEALGLFSELVAEGKLVQAPAGGAPPEESRVEPEAEPEAEPEQREVSDDEISDLMADIQSVKSGGKKGAKKKPRPSLDDDDGIVDILTGERIK